MIALISGINGFLGRALSEHLLHKGYHVYGIPRDLFTNAEKLTAYLVDHRPDYIYHAGAYGHHFDHKDVDLMLATNVFNTYVLLKFSEQLPLKKFIYIGTSSEYGPKTRAMRETDTLSPVGPYAVTKAQASMMTALFKNTVVVRPFSLFGEGEADWRFMPTIVRSLKKDDTMNLVPEVRHDWIYVKDAADAMIRVGESALTGAVNIGMGRQMSNLEVVREFEKIAGKKLKYNEVQTLRSYDTNYWVANTTRLKSIGYAPTYGIKAGLKRTYDYY